MPAPAFYVISFRNGRTGHSSSDEIWEICRILTQEGEPTRRELWQGISDSTTGEQNWVLAYDEDNENLPGPGNC
jgi:hypothetical protein